MENNPTESKCILLTEANKFQLGSRPIPELQKEQILIQQMAAPINPSDVLLLAGLYPTSKKMPFVPGIQGCGRVIKSGGGQLSQGLVGKKVCYMITGQPFGTYSQYVVVSAYNCVQLDESVSYDQGSMSLINPVTVYGMLQEVKAGNHKTIIHTAGASQLGRMMTRYFQENGVDVISIVRKKQQIQQLQKQEGAKYVLNSSDQSFDRDLSELVKKLQTKFCYDAIGGTFTGKILTVLPPGSVISVYGVLSGDSFAKDISIGDLLFQDKTVRGFWLATYLRKKNNQERLKVFQHIGQLVKNSLKSNIAKEVSLETLQDGLDFYKSNMSAGKVIVKPW